MRRKVTLDKAGRLVLPKALREELRLSPGDALDVSVEAEQLTLRPHRAVTPLGRERGVWVLRTGEPLAAAETRETLRAIREQRTRRHAGDRK